MPLLRSVRGIVKAMRPPSAAAYATFAIAWSISALGSACVDRAAARARAGDLVVCPTIPAATKDAFVVHGAKVQDGALLLDPADVVVANGEVIAVGASICFRAVGGSVAFVDGSGATLVATSGRIAAGDPADLSLVEDSGNVRTTWRRGVVVR